MSKLKDVEIKWNKKIENLIENKDEVVLEFQDSKEKANFVIGCDGVYSNVRKIFDNSNLNYLNIIVVLGIVYIDHYLTDKCTFETSNGLIRFFSLIIFILKNILYAIYSTT
jgi:2-polyprenyl-6-methoxyphenol hydroxylase-like FAD-dependent oxidoreductase